MAIGILIFLALVLLGGYVGQLLRIPMGTILGSMLAVGISKHMGWLMLEPLEWLSFIVQLLLGMMIALSFTKLDKEQLKQLGFSLLFIFLSVVIMTTSIGVIIHAFFDIELSVSILSSAPGGMVEMATMADALGLYPPMIVFLHFIRLLLVMLIYPFIIQYSKKFIAKTNEL
ncbi:hypothetical protein BTR23_18805 [Alkalihalophilus pseudofirmus]|nr:hypothetical protein BTR23_18805 [Alkalihalophilus pseudofirmus]